MGGDSNDKTQGIKTIYDVAGQFQEMKNELDKMNDANHPVVSGTLTLIATAVETILAFHKERTETPISSIEYAQTINSLTNYKSAALSYLENQDNRYRDKLYEISGHIVDRVSQKALEWGGKTALKKYYEQQQKNIEELASIVSLLKSSAETLNQYVNDEATDTLHADYFQDYNRYSRWSAVWLFLFAVMGGIFALMVFQSIFATPQFINEFIKGKEVEGIGILVMYAFLPRIALTAVALFVLAAFWRNYQAYKHLEVSTKAKLNVAKMMPVLRLNAKDTQEYSALQLEFIKQMSQPEETGFFHQSKMKSVIGIGPAKIE